MRRYKTFILGGRSGTTLLHKCLLKTSKFIDWSGPQKREVLSYAEIINFLPEIKDEVFNRLSDLLHD